ncbi:uncharacterized protein [Chelonus insularis]|uniref:uncharacterized protein n=1 Tax=Chelonus insularis TaxID=460826 RepID=UPI001588941A|nr:uncharacterized protein LOC118073760 [Chelonus insularis]
MANMKKCFSNMFLNIAIDNIQKHAMLYGISRTLYTEGALHLDKYVRSRRVVYEMFQKSNSTLFKIKMGKLVADEKSIVNLNDIHATCCIITKNPKDINLLDKMVHKISKQNNSTDSNQLAHLGSHIMMTLHHVKGTNLALKISMNPQYDNIFHFPLTQLILLDLLFESKKFREVRQAYDRIIDSMAVNYSFTNSVSTLIAVSCYKENTQESLEYGLKFYENLIQKNISVTKVIAALGILALNQKSPEVTLRLMELHKIVNINHICIEIMALADLNKLDGVEKHLEFIKNTSNPELQCLSEEIVPKIKDAIERVGADNTSKISQLLCDLINNGYVQKSIFDRYLLSPIKKEQVSVRFPKNFQQLNRI